MWYYGNFLVGIFFNSALMGCANIRLSGGKPSVRAGLRIAFSRIGRIAAWALVAATVGIFLPAFLFVAVSAPLMPRLRSSRTAGAILDGINVASLALMALVTWQVALAAFVDWFTLLLGIASAVALLRYRHINSVWLVLAAGALGIAKHGWF